MATSWSSWSLRAHNHGLLLDSVLIRRSVVNSFSMITREERIQKFLSFVHVVAVGFVMFSSFRFVLQVKLNLVMFQKFKT
jgi:hypothetical protein